MESENLKELTASQRYYRKNKDKLREYGKQYYVRHKEAMKKYYKEKNKNSYKNLSEEQKKNKNQKTKEWFENHKGYMENYNKQYKDDNKYKNIDRLIELLKKYLNKDYTKEQIEKLNKSELANLKNTLHNERCKKYYHDNEKKYKASIECQTCGKKYKKCNHSSHLKTVFHKLHADIKNAINKI